MDDRKAFYDFLRKHSLAVLSTVNKDGKPESAVVEFAESKNLEIIFDTINTFRKYDNLMKNPYVSAVIGWDEDMTMQYEGKVTELKGSELERYREMLFHKLPDTVKYASREGITYFKIVPTWIRFTDLRTYPWKVSEMRF